VVVVVLLLLLLVVEAVLAVVREAVAGPAACRRCSVASASPRRHQRVR
jgi:hypothetical protein